MKIESILVPTDFSADAEKAIDTGCEFAKQFGAKLVVLHAYRLAIPISSPMGGGYVPPAGFFEEVRAQANDQVQKLTQQLVGRGLDVTGHAVEGAPSFAIVEEAERLGVDLIVIGTRGLTGIKHVALGSVAERVVRHAHCPVLTVKADA
jgi:universal stress protein A